MAECLKRRTKCVVLVDDEVGTRYEATNDCDVEGLDVCPRIIAGVPDGVGYEMCRSVHAEAIVAQLLPDGITGTAYLYGHDYLCPQCQHALTDKGVTTFVIATPRGPHD
jgi:deoxycytidylate deaminase